MAINLSRKFVISEDYKLLLFAGIVDLMAAPVLQFFDPYGINTIISDKWIVRGIYGVLFYIFVLLLIAIHNELIEKMKRGEKKDIAKLSNALKEGIKIKKQIEISEVFQEESEIKIQIENYKKWRDETLALYTKIKPIKAVLWDIKEVEVSSSAIVYFDQMILDIDNLAKDLDSFYN